MEQSKPERTYTVEETRAYYLRAEALIRAHAEQMPDGPEKDDLLFQADHLKAGVNRPRPASSEWETDTSPASETSPPAETEPAVGS